VVDRVRGKKLGMAFLKEWVISNWIRDISKMPLIRLLERGWFAFIFSSREDVNWVLLKVWSMAGMPIVLKRWTPTFDAKKERVDEEPIWVHLSGLPMQFWNSVKFAAIGNKLGSFIEADMSFEESGHMSVARILVRLDLQPSLLDELVIESSSGSFIQTLDYEGIPFICHRCHVYGHRVADCTLPFKGKSRFNKGDE
jgi:hypothetical protein